MNKIIRKIGGIIAIIIGAKYLMDALFFVESEVMGSMVDASVRAMYLAIGLGLAAVGYYFGLRTKSKE